MSDGREESEEVVKEDFQKNILKKEMMKRIGAGKEVVCVYACVCVPADFLPQEKGVPTGHGQG